MSETPLASPLRPLASWANDNHRYDRHSVYNFRKKRTGSFYSDDGFVLRAPSTFRHNDDRQSRGLGQGGQWRCPTPPITPIGVGDTGDLNTLTSTSTKASPTSYYEYSGINSSLPFRSSPSSSRINIAPSSSRSSRSSGSTSPVLLFETSLTPSSAKGYHLSKNEQNTTATCSTANDSSSIYSTDNDTMIYCSPVGQDSLSPLVPLSPLGPSKLADKFWDNPEKKKHFKVEMCEAYPNCRFKDKCNYAHNEAELRLTKLIERHEAGLLDMKTFRTKPCLTFVSTGSCPFDARQRCDCIHDPRVKGVEEWWLPHFNLRHKTQSLNNDFYVDWYGETNFSTSHYGHPFGPLFPEQLHSPPLSYEDFSDVICSTKSSSSSSNIKTSKEHEMIFETPQEQQDGEDSLSHIRNISSPLSMTEVNCQPQENSTSRQGSLFLTEYQRLSIALKMRYDHSDMYKYKHKITDVLFQETSCMLIQTRTFEIPAAGAHDSGEVEDPVEIPVVQFDSSNQNHVIVREISFGPPLSSTDRKLALWFDIHDHEVRKCTNEELKRSVGLDARLLRKKKQMERRQASSRNTSVTARTHINGCNGRLNAEHKTARSQYDYNHEDSYKEWKAHTDYAKNIRALVPTSFDDDESPNINKPFYVCIPRDQESYALVTEVLQNRLNILKSKMMTGSSIDDTVLSLTHQDYQEKIVEKELERKFNALVKHFSMFHFFPVNDGRDIVDESTPLPALRENYNFPKTTKSMNQNDYNELQKNKPWHESFKERIWDSFLKVASANFEQEEQIKDRDDDRQGIVLEKRGNEMRALPHIKSKKQGEVGINSGNNDDINSINHRRVESEFYDTWYWKDILDNEMDQKNGWTVMKRHYIKPQKEKKEQPKKKWRKLP